MKHVLILLLALISGSQARAVETISGPLATRIFDIMAYMAELEDEDENTVGDYRKVNSRNDARGNLEALVIGNARINAPGESFECTPPVARGFATCTSSHATFPAASGGLSASLLEVLHWGFQVEETVTGITNRIQRLNQGYTIGSGTTALNCRSFSGPGLATVEVEQCKIIRALR